MKLLFLTLLVVSFCCPMTMAQNQTSANRPAETLGEDERLPFMAHDESAAPEPSTSGLMFRTLGALLLIGGFIFGGAWILKKFGGANFSKSPENPDLAVVSSVSVGANRTLSVVRFGDQTLLVGSTAQNFTLLATENRFASHQFDAPTRSVAELLAGGNFAEEEMLFSDKFDNALAKFDDERGRN